jgi:alkaline phosphatase
LFYRAPMLGSLLSAVIVLAVDPPAAPALVAPARGSVIFIHPDGTGLGHWGLARVHQVGPDGRLAWDTLPSMALYRPHVRDSLAPASNTGGTIHAYGVKVPLESYGMDGTEIPRTPTGERISLMRDALRDGRSVGIINSGHLAEPGTGCFLASVQKRSMVDEICRQLLEGKPNVILGGGEAYFLPKGVAGRHGAGRRADGRNLVEEARAAGYTVVFTREELAAIPAETTHLLGLFAETDTYNDATEEVLATRKLPFYAPTAPTVAEMTDAALRVLSRNPKGFFLAVEEEGTDNFSNLNNAGGLLEAMRRADATIATAERFRRDHPDTLVLVASDSDASRPQLVAMPEAVGVIVRGKPLPPTLPNDPAPIDGVAGSRSEPFLSAPDARGVQFPFAVAWASHQDGGDPVVVRAAGVNSEFARGDLDNTALYRIMHATLFGVWPEQRAVTRSAR